MPWKRVWEEIKPEPKKKKVLANTIKNNNAIVHMNYSEECKSMSQALNKLGIVIYIDICRKYLV